MSGRPENEPAMDLDGSAPSHSLSIDALGAVVRIDGSQLSEEAWAVVRDVWSGATVDADSSAKAAATVTAHGALTQREMLTGLSTDVTLAAIEARAGEILMLHAAGLALPNGHVVALVGPSGRGKTTASRVLGREFGYVSDETVAIDADGTVLPFRKPLSQIEPGHVLKRQSSPAGLGLRPLPEQPLRLSALVLLDRTEVAREPVLAPVSVEEALAGLAEQASYLGRMSAPLHTIAAHTQAVGGVHRLTYSDVETLAPLIRELGSRVPRDPRIAVDESRRPPTTSAAGEGSTDAQWSRAESLDEVDLTGGRLAVLARVGILSTSFVVLDGVGPTLWRTAARPTSFDGFVRAAIEAHGVPADADPANLIASSLANLEEARLLTRLQ